MQMVPLLQANLNASCVNHTHVCIQNVEDIRLKFQIRPILSAGSLLQSTTRLQQY